MKCGQLPLLDSDEFYDLRIDPQETTNRIHDEQYRNQILKMKETMLKWLQETSDVVPKDIDNRFTKEMLWSKMKDQVPEACRGELRRRIDAGAGFLPLMEFCQNARKEKHVYEKA